MDYNFDIDATIGYPITKQYVRGKLASCKKKPCAVRINSYGGDVQTALDIRQQFLDHGDVTAYIFGMTASAATVLAMGAKKICMSKYALMLLHKSSAIVFQWEQMNADDIAAYIKELQDQKADLSKIDNVMANLYALRSGKTAEKIGEVMQKAAWLTADECKELGLIDEIVEEGETEPMTAELREHFVACGLPIPEFESKKTDDETEGQSVKETLISTLKSFFHNNNNKTMNEKFVTVNDLLKVKGIDEQDGKLTLSAAQIQTIEDSLKQHLADINKLNGEKATLEQTIAENNKQIKNLKNGDGDTTNDINGDAADEDLDVMARSNKMYNLLD